MKKILFFLLIVVVFASCNKNQFKDFEQTESGLYYKIHVDAGDTTKAREGDVMTVLINYRTLENKPVDSNYKSMPIEIRMRPSIYKGDIFEGLGLLSIGDSATFVASTDSFFTKLSGSPIPPTLDSGSFFYIDVKVQNIQNQAEMMRIEAERMAMLQEAETALLTNYIADNKITIAPDSNGMFVIKSKKGNGKVVKTGNYATIHLKIGSLSNDEILYNTYEQMPEGTELMIGTGYFGIGFDLCLQGSKVGDVFKAIVPSKMAFGERGAEGIVPPYTTLVYDCEVIAVYTEEEHAAITKKKNDERLAKQAVEIKDYAAKNGFTAKPDADGIYKKIIKEGAGNVIGSAKAVKVHYTGKLLNGTKFDSSLDRNTPFSFTVGAGEVIPGWDKVVSEMKVGEKAFFIIPSAMAYGSQAAGSIPPFSPLSFEIEVIELVK
jgi:FKBP-type peptidyl-prolyl cis-trans isomerase